MSATPPPSSKRPRVLCTGVAVLDAVFGVDRVAREPVKTFARDFVLTGGGPAANGAVTVVRLGGVAALWARVGDDAVGKIIVDGLEETGVDVSRVRRVPGARSGVTSVIVDADGERFITAFADRTLDPSPDHLPIETIVQFDLVLCDVRWPAASEAVLRTAREAGVPTVLDADLTNDDALARLAPLADHVVFSAPALRRLTGEGDPATGLRLARRLCSGVLGVTLGGDGSAWLIGDEVVRVSALRVGVVDTLAAGDVFHGAYALALAEGRSVLDAARFAGAAATLKCMRWGGRAGIPDREALESVMAEGLDSSTAEATTP